jgi:hypothetical protein
MLEKDKGSYSMSRARNIKPSFFKNEVLASCSPHARLMFIGLWGLADREGRLEDRPLRIKAEVLPYENQDIEKLLSELSERGFILRYQTVNGMNIKYIQILNFTKHQNPHVKESASLIPAPGLPESSRSDPLLLIPDSPIPLHTGRQAGRFADFWKAYPKKVKRKTSEQVWKLKNLDGMADKLIEDIAVRLDEDDRWKRGFIPDPTTYLRQERWADEITPPQERRR